MTHKDDALKMAKSWFESNTYGDEAVEVYEAIEQALAAPVQEPVVTDWERIAKVQDAKLRAMCNEPKAFEQLCELMDKYEALRPTPPAAQPAPVQEPVAWVTVEDGKCISTRSADFRHIADGQYQLYVGPLAYEVPAAIKTLEALGYIYEEGEQWTAPPAAQPAPVADFDDPLVQTVYNILCDADEGKPREDHWEGWKARRIVAALTTPPAAPVQPVASLKEVDVLMMAETHGIDPNTKGLYGFYIDCISNQPAAQPAVQEPVGYITQARCFVHLHECTEAEAKLYGWKTIYTTPPAAQPAPVQELLWTLKENAIGCGLKDPITAVEYYSKHIEVQNLYTPAQPAPVQPVAHSYTSTQATTCACCGEHKHTPLRIDKMGGYVCLTCIDKKLGSLLGEFGYPPAQQALAAQPAPVAQPGESVDYTPHGRPDWMKHQGITAKPEKGNAP